MIVRNILITAPTGLPVTDAQILAQLKEDDANIGLCKVYAEGAVDDVQGDLISVQLMQATYELQMDSWLTDPYPQTTGYSTPGGSGFLTLPKCPLVSITSVKYDDVNNVEQTLSTSNYQTDTSSLPGRIRWASNASLPGVYDKPNCIRIRYVAGYGAAAADIFTQQDAVPALAKSMVLIRLADLKEIPLSELVGMSVGKSERYWSMVGKLRIPV